MGFWARLKAKFAGGAPGPQAADVPVLMLDTGGHMALIRDVAFTPDGTQLVSASEDKTIRVWDVATGSPKRTIRGEVALGDAGKIYAMALSPDDKWLAAGGLLATFTGDNHKDVGAVRLYDFASGKLVVRLLGHENVVNGLAFSRDGRHLISGSSDSTAIIWKVETRQSVGCDQTSIAAQLKHRLRGHQDDIYAVGFTPDGQRAVTGSLDHDLRLWRVADGGEIARMRGHGDKVRSLAVAPDGTIASGDMSGEIRLWDGKTGAFVKVLAQQSGSGRSLSFSADGKVLLSGVGAHPFECQVYDLASSSEIVTYRGHDNIVIATAISPDGRWAATGGSANQEIHIWDLRTGERRLDPDDQPLTFGGRGRPVWAVGFSADGGRIGWGNTDVGTVNSRSEPFEYALMLPSGDVPPTGPVAIASAVPPHPAPDGAALSHEGRGQESGKDAANQPSPPSRSGLPGWANKEPGEGGATAPGEGAFVRALAEQNGWSLSHRKGGNFGFDAILDIKQGDRVLASVERGPTDGYDHRSYSFTPDGKTIISGGMNGYLTAYTLAGKKLGDFIGHEGDVWAVAPSPDGRLLVSGADDQTVRLWNLATRELLVTLFHGSDGEWVMWTPQGYYVSSPDGDALIGWQINHGPAATPDHVEARQLARRLYRPDIITRTIELASAKAALAELGAPANIIDSLRLKRPPEFAILMPADGTKVAHNPAAVVVRVAANDDPVEGFELSVNGRQVASRDIRSLNGHDIAGFDQKTLNVPLEKGSNRIRITARNAIGETERELTLHFAGHGALSLRGTLYVVAVGVNDYVNLPKEASLRFAAADALAFRTTLERHAKALHKGFESVVLAKGGDREPTRANIEDALALFRDARPEDTVMLFLAGHGTNEGPSRLLHGTPAKDALRHTDDYLFLPQDSAVDGKGWRPSSVVRWLVFQNALQNARGRRLMFVDTCHAGGAYNPRLVKDAHDAEIIVFSATDAGAKALERAELGHGVFTFALTQGLEGGAADGNGEVELFALQSYVSRQVKTLSGGCQAPAIHLSGVKDFVIAKK